MPLDEIARLEALGGAEINEAKKILATEATAMVHGREAALRAAEAARQTFALEATGVPFDTSSSPANLANVLDAWAEPPQAPVVPPNLNPALLKGLPTIEIPAGEIEAGLGVLTAFVRSGLVASTSEARRQIIGGGLKINDRIVTDERMVIGPRDLIGRRGQTFAREEEAYFIEGCVSRISCAVGRRDLAMERKIDPDVLDDVLAIWMLCLQ